MPESPKKKYDNPMNWSPEKVRQFREMFEGLSKGKKGAHSRPIGGQPGQLRPRDNGDRLSIKRARPRPKR